MTREDLLTTFRRKVDETNQGTVSKALGYSRSTINQVYHGNYGGDLTQFLVRVDEIYGSTVVPCPELGEIPLGECSDHRRRGSCTGNSFFVRMYRACQQCPHNDKGGRP